MKTKTVVTITSSKSDLIRVSGFCEDLDKNFDHILIHDNANDDELIEELQIRKPDYKLNYYPDQQAIELIKLLRKKKIHPNIILLLGDSDFTTASVTLKKEGYIIGHIGAGQRSHNRNAPKEINRVICDHCSDYHFIYHRDYGINLTREKLPKEKIFTIGNTIEKTTKEIYACVTKGKLPNWFNKHIILDISLPENFKNKKRLSNILVYANDCGMQFGAPVYMLERKPVMDYVEKFFLSLGVLRKINFTSHIEYAQTLAQSIFLIADSATNQEEPSLFGIPTIIPRNTVEHPLSVKHGCSLMLNVNSVFNPSWRDSYEFIESSKPDPSWLEGEDSSQNIVDSLEIILNN